MQELEPGAPQKLWVQSQATIAEIDKDVDGHFVARVLKQKIWVEGISYELQEIYGMEHASSNKGSEVGPAPALQGLQHAPSVCLQPAKIPALPSGDNPGDLLWKWPRMRLLVLTQFIEASLHCAAGTLHLTYGSSRAHCPGRDQAERLGACCTATGGRRALHGLRSLSKHRAAHRSGHKRCIAQGVQLESRSQPVWC